ncbi:MAG: BatA and WFA domain-containing protein [Planctomycetes bacterium]|nr:BatA and WFA domain-containing protein [Planctomycetota bacterium]
MNFLSPGTIAIAAALTVPPLVALYFLKLKREVHAVSSTMLWKRAVQDLHVNSPFQRLRSNLLLFLQLLLLCIAVVALGQPMCKTVETNESTYIIMIDQSASMNVLEADGKTRLERAKEQAKRTIEGMPDDGRAMVIAFCDRATVVSSFDTDKTALARKIDSIEPTQSSTALGEAMSLAEAYTQNIIIGTEETGGDIAPETTAPPASVFLFTDGRVADAELVSLQSFDVAKMTVQSVGTRADNVGIIAMDARRSYERPEILEVAATVQNFGPDPITFDAVLYVDGDNLDVQTVELPGAPRIDDETAGSPAPEVGGASDDASDAADTIQVIAFDPVEFSGGGVVEVALRTQDALDADNRAWTVVPSPRHVRVLLVTPGNLFLEKVLGTLPLDFETMTAAEYEAAPDEKLLDGQRSTFDVVIMDTHSTDRLPHGNYLFWGSVPLIDGVALGEEIKDEVIFNWDETHPVLRYVAAETISVNVWRRLIVPTETVSIIDGQTSPVLCYLARDASQFLISAFPLIAETDLGEPYMNTTWVTQVDFVVFMQNAIQFLSSNVATRGRKGVSPGDPITLPVPEGTKWINIRRPDNSVDRVPTAGYQTAHYARTRQVGVYRAEPGVAGDDVFTVNLFDPVESRVEPAKTLTIGSASVEAKSGTIEVNQPMWSYFLIAFLVVLMFEWVVYNKRVFV